jgi:hypothetical protein
VHSMKILGAGLALLGVAFLADGPDHGESQTLDSVVEDFVGAPGFEALAPDALLLELAGRLRGNPESIFPPDARLGPLSKGLLMVEVDAEAHQPVRYRLRYGEVRLPQPPKAVPLTLSLVEIQRFDLAPAWQEALVRIHGDAARQETRSPQHQTWRLATRPIQGQAALVEAISSREMPKAEAETIDCLGLPCAGLDSLDELDGPDWQPFTNPALPDQVPYAVVFDGVPSPAALLDMALAEIGAVSADGDGRWLGFEPREGLDEGDFFLEIVIERGLAPEARSAILLHEGYLMDHLVQAQWVRMKAVAGGFDQPPLIEAERANEYWPRLELEH